jgi:hypothetical protein
MTDESLALLFEFAPGQSLEEVQDEYRNERLFPAMQDYLSSTRPITAFRNDFRQAVNDAFTMAFIAGWADAGASGELSSDAQSWLSDRISQEITFSDTLFTQLKALRDDPELTYDEKIDAAEAHADAYTQTLVGVYNMGKMMGEPEQDARWEFGDTDHCDTCSDLNGQTHPLSWFIDNGYIPQESGSETLDCHGYNCQCRIMSDKTGKQLIP